MEACGWEIDGRTGQVRMIDHSLQYKPYIMAISRQQLKYYLTNLRTRRSYMFFHIFQLVLSCLIILLALLSTDLFRATPVLCLQFILLLCMAIDLFVIRWVSEGGLFKRKRNIVDFVIVGLFAGTFVFMCATENKEVENGDSYAVIIEVDDVILITIIVARYLVQIWQMISMIKNTRKNMQIQRDMKDVDLNKSQNSSVIDEGGNDAAQDQMMRKRLEQRDKNQKERKEKEVQM